MRIYT